ncbi:nuclear transport factor 2 family protein [Streptomyces bacillaris]|uniref:nuclear transport factor 2 family protein n=1 Tax=Streptomyces TaxID=1883 RepID=UPI0027E41891|nr:MULTISPECIES: nuclear transport factor 2 family protein [Streptomyces]
MHENWFDRTAAKDLDGVMQHIADDIVSYEHDTPLQYMGRDQVREVCRQGLEWAPGPVTWDVPDMSVRCPLHPFGRGRAAPGCSGRTSAATPSGPAEAR